MRNTISWALGAIGCVLMVMGGLAPSYAQNAIQAYVVAACGTPGITLTAGKNGPVFQNTAGNLCTSGSGGGGGLSVTDQATFTAGTSSFTPGGGFYNSSQQTLTSGTQGTFALSNVRSLEVDTPTTNSNLNTILTAPQPYLPATTPTTNTYTTGVTSPANGDLHGAWYSDISAWAGTQLGAPSNYGTSPGTVAVPGVNAFITNTVGITANSSVNVAQFGGVSTATGQVAVSTAPVTATNTALVVDLRPDSPGIITLGPAAVANSVPQTLSSQYPTNATTTTPTAITGNATGAAGAVVGTLAAAASKTTFICGFNVSSVGGVASSGPVTVAGLIGSSQVYQTPINATAGQILISQNFNPCIPASAVNTAITITTTAATAATAVDVNSWGYQL
jgi:hypothetical protein